MFLQGDLRRHQLLKFDSDFLDLLQKLSVRHKDSVTFTLWFREAQFDNERAVVSEYGTQGHLLACIRVLR